jgi:probable selenium-dependent hydroxylase accessory protein YqeC
MRLGDFFYTYRSEVITVIGSGGKTSLVWFLARLFAEGSGRRTLVTTTTKMGAPDFAAGLFDHFINGKSPLPIMPGVTFAGLHEYGSTKTSALPDAERAGLLERVDAALIEGDGSRTLPLKGWADYEPVVPPETTVTVGIIPLWPLGMPASEAVIHRMPLFCALTGVQPGSPLTPSHIAAAVSGNGRGATAKRGLFAEARGKRILFFNQTEDENALRNAREVTGLLPAPFREGLDAVIAGSIRRDWAELL